MDKKKTMESLAGIGRDILIAFVIVAVIMLGLFAYSGIWPPMVVIESGSMEHPPGSHVGVIDTGDMVFIKKINGRDDVVTYVQGENTGERHYGAYGDVVVYRPNGLRYRGDGSKVIPIIHRLVVWVEVNTTGVSQNVQNIDYANYTFDIPGLQKYNTTEPIVLDDYGFRRDDVTIKLDLEEGLLKYYQSNNMVPHGGFITMGDNNAPSYDQPYFGGYEPVLPEWIVGKAWGELPWFGLIKLWFSGSDLGGVAPNSWTGLFGTLAIVIIVPMALDFILPWVERKRKGRSGETPGDDVAPEEEQTEEPKTENEYLPES